MVRPEGVQRTITIKNGALRLRRERTLAEN